MSERETSKIAIRLQPETLETWDKLDKYVEAKKLAWSIDLESNACLFDEKDAKQIIKKIGGQDVTETYNILKNATIGYRVVKEGRPLEGFKNYLYLVKDYSSRDYLVYEYGRIKDAFTEDSTMAREILCSASMNTVPIENPVKFYDTPQQAIASRS